MTGLLHLYAFIALVLVILVMAWIVMILHAEENPPAHGSAPTVGEQRDRAGDERPGPPSARAQGQGVGGQGLDDRPNTVNP